MIPVRAARSKGILQGTYCCSAVDGRLSPRTALRWRMSRHTSVATTARLTRPTKGEQKGNRFQLTRLVPLAADGMGDTDEDNDPPDKAPIVRPAKFSLTKCNVKVDALARLIYPCDVENQKESVISQYGDYTYMRNAEPITDEQPNFPSAMYRAKEDRSKAEAEYADAIYTVRQKNVTVYRDQFSHGNTAMLTLSPVVSPPRVFGLGLPLFSTAHEEFASTNITQYDFSKASTSGNQPVPIPGGRGGYDTDGAMFASRITGYHGGLAKMSKRLEITIATYQPENVSQVQKRPSAADRLGALSWTVNEVMNNENLDVVAIVYDPNEPFTAQEQAYVKELLQPKACAVVFLIPKDEPADMATDQRYAVMRSLQDAGALVVSSVDGDYLRTPLIKAGWGRFDYNVVVGDTEAPDGSGPDKWQLVEGTSITAAAAGCAACIAVVQAIRPRRATPRIVKQILSETAVNLKQVLMPKTIADLEVYRDQCIADCGLSTEKSPPEYQSMLNGLGVDARILRFNKKELWSAFKRVFADTLVALADVRASTKDPLAPAKELWLTPQQTRSIATLRCGSIDGLGVSGSDFRSWIRLVEAAGNQQEYAELAETARTLIALIPFRNTDLDRFGEIEFALAIGEARKTIRARGGVGDDMQWVLGVPVDIAFPVREEENPDSLEGSDYPYAIPGSEDTKDFRKQLDAQVELQWGRDTRRETVQEGLSHAVERSEGEEVPDEVQGPPNSELAADEQLRAAGREGPEAGEPESVGKSVEGSQEQVARDMRGSQNGATNESLGGEEERSWAGLLQYLVDLLTGKQGGKEGQGKEGDIDEDERVSKMTGVRDKRTWVGLIEYFINLLKKAFDI